MFELKCNQNYAACVTKLGEPRRHSGADRLQVFSVFGSSVITDLSYKQGDEVVYFPAECKISQKILNAMNLYRDKALNQDQEKVGYFESSGRVKALKLRGEWSTAIVFRTVDLSHIYPEVLTMLNGTSFDHINGEMICEKYYPRLNPSSMRANSGQKRLQRESRIVPGQFAFHMDTAQLGRNLGRVMSTVCELTEKMHGTSVVISKILTKKKLPLYLRLLKKIGVPIIDTQYDVVYSSRKVIKNDFDADQKTHYYSDDIWGLAVKSINPDRSLENGITLYAEIVGYLPNGQPIQGSGGMSWDYGHNVGEFGVYIYRITQTTTDGSVIEFTPQQIEAYCEWKGLNRVPYVSQATFCERELDNQKVYESLVKLHATGPCLYSKSKLPREGVVARVIQRNGRPVHTFEAYKLKSLEFLGRETQELDAGKENIEDAQEGS